MTAPVVVYEESTDTLVINGSRYAAALFDGRGLLGPPGTVLRVEAGSDDTVTVTRIGFQAPMPIAEARRHG